MVTKFLDRIKSDDPRLTTASLALEAMAKQRAGNPQAARATLKKAREQLAELMKGFARRVGDNDGWLDVLVARSLTDEAARLIEAAGNEDEAPGGPQR